MRQEPPNAVVEYVDAATGAVLAEDRFYDPGLDEHSQASRELKARAQWQGPYRAYGCGKALQRPKA